MAVINNIQAYDAAIRVTGCPIDGVDADGKIYFASGATPAQIAAANAAAASYTDAAPQIVAIERILAAMTDAEYTSFMAATAPASRVALHRIVYQARKLDLSLPQVQTLIQNLVTAGVLTQARANVIFVAPPAPPAPVAVPLPPLVNLV
jgi:hypothetical protein